MIHESVPLLFKDVNSDLSLFFATLCIVDIFGVFPIIALPSAIVQCEFNVNVLYTRCNEEK
ncbi:amino acid transporter AVT1B [Vespula squamosa]|uniref:Amino acid transporter AVT1B n=1 Tax=Vespula squamosa TaxID=30214 RepID=A0ABD2BNM0_VESSQ